MRHIWYIHKLCLRPTDKQTNKREDGILKLAKTGTGEGRSSDHSERLNTNVVRQLNSNMLEGEPGLLMSVACQPKNKHTYKVRRKTEDVSNSDTKIVYTLYSGACRKAQRREKRRRSHSPKGSPS